MFIYLLIVLILFLLFNREIIYKKIYKRDVFLSNIIYVNLDSRIGNQLSELSFNILLAQKYNFKVLRLSKPVFKSGKTIFINENFKSDNVDNIDYILSQKDKFYSNSDFNISLSYPHNILLHYNESHLEYIRKILFKKELLHNNEYDIGIHLRLGDIIDEDDYKLYKVIPIDFILKSLKISHSLNKSNFNLIIVGEFSNENEKTLLFRYIRKINKLNFIKKIQIKNNSEKKDFKTLITIPRIIMSVSTFSYWASLLNKDLKELYIPMYNLTKNEIGADYWPKSKTKIFKININNDIYYNLTPKMLLHYKKSFEEKKINIGNIIDHKYALYPKEYYKKVENFSKKKIYDFIFIGAFSFSIKELQKYGFQNRSWTIEFAKKFFTKNSIFVNTTKNKSLDTNWKVLGVYDYTFKDNNFITPKYLQDKDKALFDENYYKKMCNSKFCLCPAGDCMYSMRFYEALMCKCIPIVDKVEETYRTFEESKIGYKYYLSSNTSFIYRKDWAEHNYKLFLKYHTLDKF